MLGFLNMSEHEFKSDEHEALFSHAVSAQPGSLKGPLRDIFEIYYAADEELKKEEWSDIDLILDAEISKRKLAEKKEDAAKAAARVREAARRRRTKELIELGGLVRLSGLSADPATLLGGFLRLKEIFEADELQDSYREKAKELLSK